MKKYIIPTTDCIEILAASMILEESGEGMMTTEPVVNPDQSLAPARPWVF